MGCLLQVLWCAIPWENPGSDTSEGEEADGVEEAPFLEQRDELCLARQTEEDDHKAGEDALEVSMGAWLIALSMESCYRSSA